MIQEAGLNDSVSRFLGRFIAGVFAFFMPNPFVDQHSSLPSGIRRACSFTEELPLQLSPFSSILTSTFSSSTSNQPPELFLPRSSTGSFHTGFSKYSTV